MSFVSHVFVCVVCAVENGWPCKSTVPAQSSLVITTESICTAGGKLNVFKNAG